MKPITISIYDRTKEVFLTRITIFENPRIEIPKQERSFWIQDMDTGKIAVEVSEGIE